VTPKDVSWSENRRSITSTGAALAVQIHWDTPSDSDNGAHGKIYLDFPTTPAIPGPPTFHSGGYQKDDNGRYVIREVTTYRNTFLLMLARFTYALPVGLPVAIVLHTIAWIFVLKREKRRRFAALAPQGPGLPRTFYPNPIEEWGTFLLLFGVGGFAGAMMGGIAASEGFMISFVAWFVYIVLAIMAGIGLTIARFTRKNILTVRVNSNGLSYARGRGDLQWVDTAWSDIHGITEKSRTYRGNTTYWIEVEFNDGRKKLRIAQTTQDYADLRALLQRSFAAGGQA
jgi:hypothetical protein